MITFIERKVSCLNQYYISFIINSLPFVSDTSSIAMAGLLNDTTGNATADILNTNTSEIHHFHFLLTGVGGLLICCVGILSNIINILVLSSMLRRYRWPSTYFLLVLGFSDMFVLTFYLIYIAVCVLAPVQPLLFKQDFARYEGTPAHIFCSVWYTPANIFVTLSNYCIVSMMVFRFLAVYFPLKVKQLCTVTRAKLTLATISIFSFFLVFPEFLTYRLKTDASTKRIFLETLPLFSNKDFNKYYYGVLEAFNSIIPFIACALLSVMLIKALYYTGGSLKGQGQLRKNSKRKAEHRKVTVLLLSIALFFIACSLPSFVCRVVRTLLQGSDTSGYSAWAKVRAVADMSLLINHSANFILYAATSSLYRSTCANLFCCRSHRDLARQASVAMSLRNTSLRESVGIRSSPPLCHRYERRAKVNGNFAKTTYKAVSNNES